MDHWPNRGITWDPKLHAPARPRSDGRARALVPTVTTNGGDEGSGECVRARLLTLPTRSSGQVLRLFVARSASRLSGRK